MVGDHSHRGSYPAPAGLGDGTLTAKRGRRAPTTGDATLRLGCPETPLKERPDINGVNGCRYSRNRRFLLFPPGETSVQIKS